MRSPALAVFLLVLLGPPCAGPVWSSAITYEFSGVIDRIWASDGVNDLSATFAAMLPFQIGDEAEGVFTYDTTTVDLFPDSPGYGVYEQGMGTRGDLDWRVGDQRFRRDPQGFLLVEVTDSPDGESVVTSLHHSIIRSRFSGSTKCREWRPMSRNDKKSRGSAGPARILGKIGWRDK